LRWKAERWMKLRHFPVVLRHDPWFVLRYAPKMMAYAFRGSTMKTFLGLEDEREAFQRYRAIRQSERNYV
jgi:anaerobic magnesium-protoporphyrin IX monomethyl ester cyclase